MSFRCGSKARIEELDRTLCLHLDPPLLIAGLRTPSKLRFVATGRLHRTISLTATLSGLSAGCSSQGEALLLRQNSPCSRAARHAEIRRGVRGVNSACATLRASGASADVLSQRYTSRQKPRICRHFPSLGAASSSTSAESVSQDLLVARPTDLNRMHSAHNVTKTLCNGGTLMTMSD